MLFHRLLTPREGDDKEVRELWVEPRQAEAEQEPARDVKGNPRSNRQAQ